MTDERTQYSSPVGLIHEIPGETLLGLVDHLWRFSKEYDGEPIVVSTNVPNEESTTLRLQPEAVTGGFAKWGADTVACIEFTCTAVQSVPGRHRRRRFPCKVELLVNGMGRLYRASC